MSITAMSNQADAQSRILARVRALVERGERVPAADIAALFTVADTNALARIARVPRERRFGRAAFYTDASGSDYRAETAESIDAAAQLTGGSYADVIAHMRSTGRIYVSGEGAELFDESLRARLAPRAVAADTWLAVHRAAHEAGIRSIATMTYLTAEHPEAYAAHLEAIRLLQDETGGFAAFVPLPVHNRHHEASYRATPTAHQSLRAVAIARIALDNVEHIGVAPALVGAEVAYIAMSYGADVVDTTITPASVRMLESDAQVGFDLPVLDQSAPSAAAETELVASRLIEARFVPTAVDLTMTPRMDAITREAL